RTDFIDTNFLRAPVFSSNGGAITSGFRLTISAPTIEPNTTTYYTVNGLDPRLPGGAIAPYASASQGSFSVTLLDNARVFARNFNLSHNNMTGGAVGGNPSISSPWSGSTVGTFVVRTPPLAITEIMYHPTRSGTTDGDEFEFIELKNVGTQTLNLVGMRFTNGIDFSFTATNPITSLASGQYVVLVKNRTAFTARYPAVANIAGSYTGSLDNSGERICLEGPLREPILDFRYGDEWYPTTDGLGFSVVVRNESAPFNTWTNPASWRASTALNGSPGRADPVPASIPDVLVNEVLTHTDPPQVDSVELHNPTASPAPIGGWFLSDNPDEPLKYCFPTNTVVPANGYLLVTESQFNDGGPNSFALSSLGDQIYLFSGDRTNLTGYRHGFAFGAQINGAAFGRHISSEGAEHLVTQKTVSLETANAGPKVGPVVITEIMYSPSAADPLDEYLELRNISSQPAPLFDPLHPNNAWRLAGGIEFTFPAGLVLGPGAFVLVVNFDPVYDPVRLGWFRSHYGLDAETAILGPFTGKLANEGDRVGLYLP
ncbi:MAG: lamin tail domain-containing protein, partial [Chloroflexi bacterium]